MRLIIDKINKVEHADIALNGLTVIVGENNTGKSTIGRLLFSVVKALNNTLSVNDDDINRKVRRLLINLRHRLVSEKCEKEYFKEGYKSERSYSFSVFDFQKDLNSYPSIDEFAKDKLGKISQMAISPRMQALLRRDVENIAVTLKNSGNKGALFSTEFSSVSESEFLNQMYMQNGSGINLILEDGQIAAKIEFDDNKSDYTINKEAGLEDITYIESPLYLHILDLLANASPYHEMGSASNSRLRLFRMVPLHIMDFANKINSSMSNYTQLNLFDSDLSKDAKNVMDGSFIYDSKRKAIMFNQASKEFFPLNVASGIKIFGVLQMLLDGGNLDATKPLVWDEPENHLHPAWQVEFAKLLIQLSKSGIPVMLTTHSPYFLQAIRYYAAKERMEEYVNYYSSKTVDNGRVRMEEVTDHLEDVFRFLAEPLNKVMNVDAVREGIEI